MAKIKIMLEDGATMPTRATSGSVGYDVRAIRVDECGDTRNADGWRGWFYKYVVCHTGIHLQPQDGYYVELLPNSRWGKRGVITYSPGQIDPDYTGEVVAIFKTLPWWLGWGKINVGDVVGQFIVRQKLDADWIVTDKLDETDRADGGFGSTEKK